VALELNFQSVELRPAGGTNPVWNQSEVLCMASFDDVLRFSIFNYKKYSPNNLLGYHDMSLDFLEYYNERSTKPTTIQIGLGTLTVSFQYRPL
jgi:Ca2+-dependent lipid-binding protein